MEHAIDFRVQKNIYCNQVQNLNVKSLSFELWI